jgi:PAS domain S-box-containing protein
MSLFEALLDSATDAVVLVDGSGRITLVNHRTEEMFGYGRGALLGSAVELLVPERQRAQHLAHRGDYAAASRSRKMGLGLDISGLRVDGSEFPVEISLSPIAVETEDFVITIIHDISEQLAADLQHAQLACEQAAHAEAETGRKRLVSILSEVDAIVWESDPRRRRFSFVSRHAEDMLGYPQAAWLQEDGFWQQIVEPEDLPLAELYLQDAVGRARDHDHEYRLRKADGQVIWVRDRVHVAVGEDGASRLHGVTMDVTARHALEEDLMQAQRIDAVGQLAVGVAHDFEDLLAAITSQTDLMREQATDESVLTHLTEISRATSRAGGLVEQLLASGQRSSRLAATETRWKLDSADQGALEIEKQTWAGVALVVEEDAPIRRLVRTVLEESGYLVYEAASGRDALAYLEQEQTPLDLILSDVAMPDITGLELVALVAPARHAPRVLFMSGYADSQLLAGAGDEPSIGVLHKPFTPAELSARVAQIMSKKELHTPSG